MKKTSSEYRTNVRYNRRMRILSDLVDEFKGDAKAVKKCRKLILSERKRMFYTKEAISDEDLRDTVWQYDRLLAIADKLGKTSDVNEYAKADSDLKRFCVELDARRAEFDAVVENGCLSDTIASGIKKIGGAVGETVERLKKTIVSKDRQ